MTLNNKFPSKRNSENEWRPSTVNRKHYLFSEGDVFTYLADLRITPNISVQQLRLFIELCHTHLLGWLRPGPFKDERVTMQHMVIANGISNDNPNQKHVPLEKLTEAVMQSKRNLTPFCQAYYYENSVTLRKFLEAVEPMLDVLDGIHEDCKDSEQKNSSEFIHELPTFSRQHVYGEDSEIEPDFSVSHYVQSHLPLFADGCFNATLLASYWVTQYLRKKLNLATVKHNFLNYHAAVEQLLYKLKFVDLLKKILDFNEVDEKDRRSLDIVESIYFAKKPSCSRIFNKWNCQNFNVQIVLKFLDMAGSTAGSAWSPVEFCVLTLDPGRKTLKVKSTKLRRFDTPYSCAFIRFMYDSELEEHCTCLETAFPKIMPGQISRKGDNKSLNKGDLQSPIANNTWRGQNPFDYAPPKSMRVHNNGKDGFQNTPFSRYHSTKSFIPRRFPGRSQLDKFPQDYNKRSPPQRIRRNSRSNSFDTSYPERSRGNRQEKSEVEGLLDSGEYVLVRRSKLDLRISSRDDHRQRSNQRIYAESPTMIRTEDYRDIRYRDNRYGQENEPSNDHRSSYSYRRSPDIIHSHHDLPSRRPSIYGKGYDQYSPQKGSDSGYYREAKRSRQDYSRGYESSKRGRYGNRR